MPIVPRRILLATDNRFWRRAIGSQQRIWALHSHLRSQGHDVRILFVGDLTSQDKQALIDARLLDTVYRADRAPPTAIQRVLQAIKQALPSGLKARVKSLRARGVLRRGARAASANRRVSEFSDYVSPKHVELLQSIVQTFLPDVLLVEYVKLSYLVRHTQSLLPQETLRILDSHDVMSERHERFLAAGETAGLEISPQEEAQELALFDCVLAIQDRDAAKLRELAPQVPVIVVRHPHKIEAARHNYRLAASVTTLGFIGSGMRPNVVAAEFLIREMMPALRTKSRAPVRLIIAGHVCEVLDIPGRHDDTEHMGFIEDVNAFYERIDVLVNPVTFGGGLKIKNVEALCRGIPLVTTAVGAEGLESGAGSAFLLAANADDFIDQARWLVEDRGARDRLATAALSFSSQLFREDVVFRDLDERLSCIHSGGSSSN